MNLNLQIAQMEKNLLQIHRAPPPANVRNGMTPHEYMELLIEQYGLFRFVADDWHPAFLINVDASPNDICVLCGNGMEDNDFVSDYGCKYHYVHSCCMQDYFQSGTEAAYRCPCCRHGGLNLYPGEAIEMDMVEENNQHNVVDLTMDDNNEEEEENNQHNVVDLTMDDE